MASLKTIALVEANQGGAEPFRRLAKSCRVCERVTNVLKSIWPKKTDANVTYLVNKHPETDAQISERAVRYWLAGTTRMSLEHVAALLASDDGYEILEAIMGPNCEVDWWKATQIAHEVRNTRRALKRAEARLAESRAQLLLLDR